MDPIIDSDWLMNKSEPIEDSHSGNIARSWVWRERGINPTNSLSNKTVLENVAEDILVQKPLKIRCCDLPGYPRSTFLMVFSPDGTKVASAHGNHNVYVSELASGKHVRILKGHPRTPWCIAFHPSHPELIGSGCLGGQVRVWDIASGGSEVWSVQKETVIASIAFHPREQLLVIATSNELYFWDWSQPAPFTKVSTDNINEKVRYVAFDSLGYKLITGISLYNVPPCATNVSEQNAHPTPPPPNYRRRQEPEENTPNNRSLDSTGPTGDVIVNSYQNLVQRYDSLVRNYQRLFLVRHRLTATTPPPSTTDRGTDPMETDSTGDANARNRSARRSLLLNIDDDSTPSTSTTNESTDNNDVDPLSRSRLLSLDALTLERGSLRTRSLSTGRQESSVFGSRPSAFQPLNESSRPSLWQARPLPSHVTPPRRTLAASIFNQENTGSSRTSVFPAYRSATPPIPPPVFLPTSFNNSISDSVDAIFPTENSVQIDYSTPSSPDVNSPIQVVYGDFPPEASNNASTSGTNTDTQPTANPRVDAQAINESLDLIRDILRDSGTRLLNLITNMSLSNLSRERRRERSRAHSDGDGSSDGTSRSRNARTRPRLFSSGLPNSLFLSSSSESDSDNPPEVNIFRTRNASFREDAPRNSSRQTASGSARPEHPIPLVLELNDELVLEENFELGGFNVSPNPRSFHVRSRNSTEESTSTRTDEEPRENRTRSSSFDPNVPSTSRQTDSLWSGGNSLTSQEAFRKVRGGVNALQKHVQQLTNFWVRGQRISMRDLRNMWENLRRRILILHRETGRQDVPSYYSRSLLERCMMLSAVSENISRSSSRTRGNPRAEDRNAERAREQAPLGTGDNEQSLTSGSPSTSRQNRNQQPRSSTAGRYSSFARRRLQPNHRWRHEDELRRRARNPTSNRLSPRLSRPRRELARAIEISATRHEIRMRAMQVLSVMFNMMMMCLEEPGLSQLIINMLRTLKKALALTCLMLMSNRNSGRGNGNTNQTSQQSDNRNSVNTELNTDSYANDTNTSESMQNSISSETEEDRAREGTSNSTENIISPTMLPKPSTSFAQDTPSSSPSTSTETWSNRLAVQIAAANRNTSAIARSRRDLYLESRRLKALHRTNPIKHPLIKKRLPPMSNHRIPSLRALPRKIIKRSTLPAPRDPLPPIVPEAMPRRRPFGENANGEPSRLPPEVMNEFEHRINLIRIAHMQAVRLRNAARNRYRRLQTIRFYAPPAMREMFSLSGDNDQNQQGARSGTSENRPAMLNRERLVARVPINIDSEDMNEIHAGEALLQVNDAVNAEGQSPQARMPRIHEYLQPIILAQNAVVVEDDDENNGEGNGFAGFGVRRVGMGGMAGLLDASLTSDNFPIPSHRIQAWDFTNRDAPNIADDEKNIVVQRCRIHNDASIDISKDGRLLVALLPVPRLRNTTHWLGKIGVYSLEWPRLGHCLHTAVLEQSAVSVALSPTGRHLAVGLGSRRFTSVHHARSNVFALLFRLDPPDGTSRTGLSPIKELEQTWEHGFTSLNCLRWAPQPGQGLVYANNTGQLIIMS